MMIRRMVCVLTLALGVWGSSGCNKLTGPSGLVEYSVTGTATLVDVTYQNSSGGTSQVAMAVVPWTYSWATADRGDFLYVSAQIVNASGGSITVTIRKDGSVLQSSTSSGFASIATASGSY
jgi:hypothetical protein